jgi:hypothetical protein
MCPHWRVTQVQLVRDIVPYDLTTPGASLAIGALPALAARHETPRPHPAIGPSGLRTPTGNRKSTAFATAPPITTTPALALLDCDNAITTAHDRTGHPLDLP